MRWLSLRALFLLGFAVGMPVLALPPVARWIDERLYGPPPADFGLPPAVPDAEVRGGGSPAPATPGPSLPMAPAAGTLSGSAEGPMSGEQSTSAGALERNAPCPQLSQTPNFAPTFQSSTPSTDGASEANSSGSELAPIAAVRIHEETIARLQAIRERLEVLGADYVLVETLAEGGLYRFHCRMRVDADSPYTRPFEASSFDPVAAGEDVLRQVEQWRQASYSRGAQDLPRR